MGEKAGYEVLLVSGDRDAFQLITDNVFVLYPKKGVSDIPRMDADAIQEKYFVSPAQYSDLAALVGESADNLPGVPGVGPKTAAKWINLYGGLEGVLENLDAIGGKVGDSLREYVEDVKRNRRLNRLHTDLDLPVTLDELADPRPDQAALEELFDALEFKTIRTRLFALYGSEVAEAERESLETPGFRGPVGRSRAQCVPRGRCRQALRSGGRSRARPDRRGRRTRWRSSATTPPSISTWPARTLPPKTSWRRGCGTPRRPR